MACPSIGLLRDTARLSRFAPGGYSIRDLEVEGVVTGVKSTCRFDSAHRRVRMAVTIQITGREGPAFAGGSVDLPFFVAVVRRGEIILAKRVFQSRLIFGEQPLVSTTENMATEVSLAPGTTTADYEVLVGFQLTPAELEYNHQHPVAQ
jgi:hypothetical protein